MLDATQIFDGTLPNTGVAVTASAATQVSTNILDLLVGRDLGNTEPLGLHVDLTAAFTTTNSATLQVGLQVCDTTNGTYLMILLSPAAIPAAQLIKGAPLFRYALPLNQILNSVAGVLKTPGRYLQLAYIVGTGVFSAGSVFSYLVPRLDRNAYYSYPNNYTAAVQSAEI